MSKKTNNPLPVILNILIKINIKILRYIKNWGEGEKFPQPFFDVFRPKLFFKDLKYHLLSFNILYWTTWPFLTSIDPPWPTLSSSNCWKRRSTWARFPGTLYSPSASKPYYRGHINLAGWGGFIPCNLLLMLLLQGRITMRDIE